MSYLIDTNVLLRFFDIADPRNTEIVEALDAVTNSTEEIFVCLQVLIEYWSVATRPREVNGLGLATADADRHLSKIESLFTRLPEPSDISERWRELAACHCVIGRQAHDARLAALMISHGIDTIITLNNTDFTRYSEITALTPAQLLRSL